MSSKAECSTSANCRNENRYAVASSDSCQMMQISTNTKIECTLCKKERNSVVLTRFMCHTCNMYCCIDCYDCHRRDQFVAHVRALKKRKDVSCLRFSKCGRYFEIGFKTNPPATVSQKKPSGYSILKTSVPTKVPSTSKKIPSDVTKADTFSSIKIVADSLTKSHGICFEFMLGTDKKLKGIYMQDAYMKDVFNLYPSTVCIHNVGRMSCFDCDLYFFITEDTNGQHEIVSVALIFVEEFENVTWVLTVFKKHNPSWRYNKTLLVDTKIPGRNNIQFLFPHSQILTCFYHALESIKNYISQCDIFSDMSRERIDAAVGAFKSVALACTEFEYNVLSDQLSLQFMEFIPMCVELRNVIKEEWTVRFEDTANLLHSLNEFLSDIDTKLKPLLHMDLNIHSFIKKVFFILKLMRNVSKSQKSTLCNSIQSLLYSRFTPEFQISKMLTSYAAEFVIQQFQNSADMSISADLLSHSYTFNHIDTTVIASVTACSCKFFVITSLPCCHIFTVRKTHSYPILDDSLYNTIWTEDYYIKAYCCLHSHTYPHSVGGNSSVYTAEEIVDSFLPRIIDCPDDICNFRISILQQLVVAWKSSQFVHIHFDGFIEQKQIQIATNSLPFEESNTVDSAFCDTQSSILGTDTFEGMPETELVEEISVNSQVDWPFGEHLSGCTYINFIYLSLVICKTKEICIQWLQDRHFLPVSMKCPSCKSDMVLSNISRLNDGVMWICKAQDKGTRKSCAKRCTVRRGTWFEGTNMSFSQILYFVYMWIHGFPQQDIIHELGISNATFSVWEKFFNSVCEAALINYSEELQESVRESWCEQQVGKDIFLAFLRSSALFHEISLI